MNNIRIQFAKVGRIALMGAVFFALLAIFAPTLAEAQYYNYDPYSYNYQNHLTVTTGNATFITKNSAALNGYVNVSSASTYIRTWFEYGTTPNYGYSTVQINSTGYSNFSGTIGSLSPNTTYYFRAVVQNANGMVFYGNSNSFRTLADYPFDGGEYPYPGTPVIPQTLTAITRPATSTATRSVDLNALVINTPGVPSSTWFEWGTDYGLGNRTPVVSVGTLPSVKHLSTITKLKPGTTYYFRAVVENPYTRSNGIILSFTTRYVATTPAEEPEPKVTPKDTIEETTVTADDLRASAFGSGFFPTSFFEWTILLILVLVLIMLSRYVFIKN